MNTSSRVLISTALVGAFGVAQALAQDREVGTLRSSIVNVTVIERQMVPLMMRTLNGLEELIALDAPFLLEEREQKRLELARQAAEPVL